MKPRFLRRRRRLVTEAETSSCLLNLAAAPSATPTHGSTTPSLAHSWSTPMRRSTFAWSATARCRANAGAGGGSDEAAVGWATQARPSAQAPCRRRISSSSLVCFIAADRPDLRRLFGTSAAGQVVTRIAQLTGDVIAGEERKALARALEPSSSHTGVLLWQLRWLTTWTSAKSLGSLRPLAKPLRFSRCRATPGHAYPKSTFALS